jgi:hypothetical protein
MQSEAPLPMLITMKYLRYGLLVGLITVIAAGTAQGTASLIDGARLEQRSVSGTKLKRGTITTAQLSPNVRKLLAAKATAGAAGTNGAAGEEGDSGPAGAAGASGANGANGAVGAKGDQGEKGEKGDSDAVAATLVTASALSGWTLAPMGDNDDKTDNGTLTFETPPASSGITPGTTSVLGSQALKMTTNSTGKPVVAYLPLPIGNDNPLLSSLTVAGYSSLVTQTPSDGAPNTDVSLQLEVIGSNANLAGGGYTTVVFDPAMQPGSVVPGVWHRHYMSSGGAFTGQVYSSRAIVDHTGECSLNTGNTCSLDRFIALNPSARVITAKLRIGQNNGNAFKDMTAFVDDARLSFSAFDQRFDLGG